MGNEDELSDTPQTRYVSDVELSDDDGVIIPKGALDPVYEAKARVLNRAVSVFDHFALHDIMYRYRSSCVCLCDNAGHRQA